jgi:hypothetical protein
MYPHAKRPGEITGETLAGVRSPVDSTERVLNTEPLNTRISSGVETMIKVDSELKGISNMFG